MVLQTLLPPGPMRAVLFSSVLFGAIYITSLAAGEDPTVVGVQALVTIGVGIAFAALVVVTGTIWPWWQSPPQCRSPRESRMTSRQQWDFGVVVISLTMGALAAAYGIWLLRRDQHRRADHSGEADQFSPPQEPQNKSNSPSQ